MHAHRVPAQATHLHWLLARAAEMSAVACLTLAACGSVAAQASTDVDWSATDAACERQDFGAALAELERLAGLGNARAAERAGHMLLLGPAMFGHHVPRDPQRAIGWLRQAASSGSETGAFLLRAASATAGAPADPLTRRQVMR